MAETTLRLPVDGTGQALRVLTNPAVDGGALQEVVTLALADGTLADPATQATLAAVLARLLATLTVGGTVTVSNPTAQGLTNTELRATAVPVSASALPLPAGAATEATVTGLLKAGQAVDVNDRAARLVGHVTVDNFPASTVGLTDAQLRATAVPVSGFPATQPVSATALPLPAGAATEATLGTVNGKTPALVGTWAYYAGASGTVVVGSGQRVIGIAVHATTAGTVTINGGASIPIPANSSIEIAPTAQLIAPTIIVSGCDSYFFEVLS